MKQNNIENQIREKLNSREIQPSSQAWDRLDAMLSIAEEKKTKPSFGWLYIAASILVFVSVGMYLFSQESSITPTETIVEIEKDTNTVKENTSVVAEKQIQNPVSNKQGKQSNPTINNKSVAVTQKFRTRFDC